ncbi:MAG: M43 family zinc metalloprotease [Bacteroidota bacterium]|nr:M43 family zinc metalloprotease [Bacteroidota bacterium]
MKKTYFIIFTCLSVFFFSEGIVAQDLKYCGQAEAEEKIKNENPELYKQILIDTKELEEYTKEFSSQRSGTRGVVYTIPVVFHIIHNNGPENISDEQVYDAIAVINKDFRKLNSDTNEIVAAFKAIAGDSEIEFKLAQKDPSGNCTNGIVRTISQETYQGDNSWNDMSTSNVSRWPRNKYLNIWVVNTITIGAAGYTYRPGSVSSSPNMDGIMVLHNYVGSIGTGSLQRSRTLTHEIGHWINLPHTWGNSNDPGLASNCNDDDGVTDTPNTIGWTSCDLGGNTCSSLDNVQNYMDYSYCSKMFTQGQSARMRAATTSTVAQRSSLWQQSNLVATGTDGTNTLCKADFVTERTEVCAGDTLIFYDLSYNNPSSWNWSFTGASYTSSTAVKNPSVVYNTPGTYSVQISVSAGVSSQAETKTNYITVLPSSGTMYPFVEGFETASSVPNNNWFVFNPDAASTWQVTNVGVNSSKSLKINNYSNPAGSIDEISSNTIDLSALSTVSVSFKVAYAQKNSNSTDELRFMASFNCGKTWVSRWNRSGANLASVAVQSTVFTPSDSTHWKEYTVTNIPASYLNSNFRFKFQFTSNGGNNIYLDDINISDPAVGINDYNISAENFIVYPNPLKDEAVIKLNLNKSEIVKVSLVDILGKETVIQSERNLTAGDHIIRLSKSDLQLSKGIYFVKLSQGEKVIVKKIILN